MDKKTYDRDTAFTVSKVCLCNQLIVPLMCIEQMILGMYGSHDPWHATGLNMAAKRLLQVQAPSHQIQMCSDRFYWVS